MIDTVERPFVMQILHQHSNLFYKRSPIAAIVIAIKKSIPIFCMKKIFTIRTTEDVYGKAKL